MLSGALTPFKVGAMAIIAMALMASGRHAVACNSLVVSLPAAVGLSGCLSQQSVDSLREHLKPGVRHFVVQSEGGGVGPAIDLARRLAEVGATLRIRGRCESSCANYLIPAAARVEAEPASRISFHGDAELLLEQTTLTADLEKIRPSLEEVRSKERSFRSDHPKAALIHQLQRIVQAPRSAVVVVDGPAATTCQGMGITFWSPAPTLLQTMGLVHAIVPDDGLLAQWLPRVEPPPLPPASGSGDPRAGCSPPWP